MLGLTFWVGTVSGSGVGHYICIVIVVRIVIYIVIDVVIVGVIGIVVAIVIVIRVVILSDIVMWYCYCEYVLALSMLL